MRLLLVSHLFLPGHRAGVETYTAQLARAFGRRHEVTVAATRKILSRETGESRRCSVEGIDLVEVCNNLVFDDHGESWASPAMEDAFARILDELRPDVVHLQHVMYWSTRLPRLARERGVPCLLTLHDYWLGCGRLGQLVDHRGAMCPGPSEERCPPCLARTFWTQGPAARRWIGRLVALRRRTGLALDGPLRRLQALRERLSGASAEPAPPSAEELEAWRARHGQRRAGFAAMIEDLDLLLTPSRTLRAFAIAQGVPEQKIRRVPQGLESAPFAGARPRAAGRPLRLGFLGTVAPHKGLHVLLEALTRLPEGSATLEIHGPAHQHGAYAADLRRRYAGHPAVVFSGPLARSGIPAFLSSIDLLCVPSLWNECCPLTIQEAFLSKTPCVVSGIGGMAELVEDGVSGRRARPGDVEDWARVLGELARRPEEVERMAASVPPVAGLDEHAAALEALYEELRARPRSGG